MPDGTVPFLLIRKWGGWVEDCISLLDGDGAFRHWKYPGSRSEQPWIDLQVYRVIQRKWVSMKNAAISQKYDKMRGNLPGAKRQGRGPGKRRFK